MKKFIFLALGLTVSILPVFTSYAASLELDMVNINISENPLASNHSRQFNLRLSPAPTSEVSTAFSTDGECLLGHGNQGFTTGGSVYTINPSLHFGVQAFDDTEYEGGHTCKVSFQASSTTDPNYITPVTKEAIFSIADDDSDNPPAYSVQATTQGTLHEGDDVVGMYQVALSIPAEDDITITATADEQCDMLVGADGNQQARTRSATVSIAGGSLAVANFTIIPREDSEFEGLHQCTINHFATTDDLAYLQVAVPSYTASITDNDTNPNQPDEREYEDGLLYFSDANRDGIQDDLQSQVISFLNQTHGKRQALIILNDHNQLHQTCSFEGGVESFKADSSQGELQVSINCTNEPRYKIMWILDKYYENASTWDIYQFDGQTALTPLQSDHVIHNLGNDFTSAIVFQLTNEGTIRLQQAEGDEGQSSRGPSDVQLIPGRTTDSASATSFVVPAVTIFIVVIGAGVFGYRRYVRLHDSRKTIAPDVDKF